ncbi:hypothetical protein HY78_03245 [Rhizorhabdus wittichii DC-6]|nr:hypothetical protein HY78_03245 [Rhizorhabdus wittichii DC-6]
MAYRHGATSFYATFRKGYDVLGFSGGVSGSVSVDFFIFAVLLLVNGLLAVAMLLAARTLGQPKMAMLLAGAFGCQSACKRDPLSARKRDPLFKMAQG